MIAPDYRVLAASSRLSSLPGEGPAGRLCHEVFFNRSEACADCAVKTVCETKRPAWSRRSDEVAGAGKISCLYAYPLLAGDEVEAVVTLELDLPPRTRVEEQLQRANAFLRNLIVSAVDGVIAADKKGKVIIFNDAAAHIFGYTISEAIEKLDVRRIYPDGLEREIMRQLRSEEYGGRGKLSSYQVDVLHHDGTRIPINLNAAIVYEGEREVATIGFFHDMRDTLRMQKELEKTQLQLLQSEKMASLGKLAAGVAHQLNNPLGGIILFTKLVLEDYDLPSGARDDLGRVLGDAERCRETVKELLEFTRQTRHLMKPHDVNQAISRTLFLLKSQSLFHDIAIETELEPQLPTVVSDIQQLNHMFMNIILNAAQAMGGKGRLAVRTANLPESGHVRIQISDTGPGIPPEVLPHIFEPFFTTKEEGAGTGLGLSLVYGIVENHGGRIKALSEPGAGATFVIDLPITPRTERERPRGDERR
ncbi:MAG: ATP-binding protein [Desulfobacterales bacterium]|nr:ATP-binding protein [Desulfobacterales bacterium]